MIWRKLLKRKILIRLFLLLMTAYMSYISLFTLNNKNDLETSTSDDLFLLKKNNNNNNNYNNIHNVKNQYAKLSNWMNYSQIKYNGMYKQHKH
jgi:hypothetical protein